MFATKTSTKSRIIDPRTNPISYQFTSGFRGSVLGDRGKVYLKRNRMNDGLIHKREDWCYAVPFVWEQPLGFVHDSYSCWVTKSEFHAVNHYRYTQNAQNHLKKKWDREILKQDYLYELSHAIDSDVFIPELKGDFKLRSHQKVGVEFGKLTNGKFIIADQQRTGKSYTSLVYALSEEWKRCLIVAPSKVVPIWCNMVQQICDIPYKVLKSDDYMEDGFNIISYDVLHTINDLNCDIAIADEAHFFLQSNARRSRAVNRINAEKKVALTGTPLMNKVEDMINIVNWIDSDLGRELESYLEYIYHLTPYEKANLIGKELRKRCLLLRETRQVGTAVEPYINFLTINTKVDNIKSLPEIGRAKVNYALDYLNSFSHQVLVIFYYRETGRMLKVRLGDKAGLIDGETPKDEVKAILQKFKDGDIQYLIGSNVLAEGIDLSHCSHMLVMEEASHSMRVDQLRERCSSIYKQEEVQIDILVVPGTQDDRLYELLGNKFALNSGLRDS